MKPALGHPKPRSEIKIENPEVETMAQLLAVVGGADLPTHAVLAVEALRKAARRRNQPIALELRGPGTSGNPLPESAILGADAVLLVGSGDLGEGRFGALRRAKVAIADVLTDVNAAIDRALGGAGEAPAAQAPGPASPTRIVAVTSCPTGIAHTFMAAEGIQSAAQALGHAVRVETQGSVGACDALTAAEIAAADLVLIAADTGVDRARFAGKMV
jgi:PTS system fructose-specific IIC component